jgi:hypothetical protein
VHRLLSHVPNPRNGVVKYSVAQIQNVT